MMMTAWSFPAMAIGRGKCNKPSFSTTNIKGKQRYLLKYFKLRLNS